MNETPRGPDLLAATRFVQAGRLTEATALLQRLLRGEPEHAVDNTVELPPAAKSGLIDLTPETPAVTAPRRGPPAMKSLGTGIGDRASGGMAATRPINHARSAAQLPRALQRQRT